MQSSWPPVIKPYQMPTTQTRPTVNCTTGPGLGNTINTTCRQGSYQIQEAIMSATIEAKRHAQAARGTNDPNEKLDEIANAIEQLVKAIEEIQKSLRR